MQSLPTERVPQSGPPGCMLSLAQDRRTDQVRDRASHHPAGSHPRRPWGLQRWWARSVLLRARGGVRVPRPAGSQREASLLVALGQPEADRVLGLRGWGDQLPQRLEDFVQLLVVLAEGGFGLSLEIFKAPLDRGVRGHGAS